MSSEKVQQMIVELAFDKNEIHEALPPYEERRRLEFNAPYDYQQQPVTRIASQTSRPIVIPQIRASTTAPLSRAYPPELLRFGITQETWLSFIDSLSRTLSANLSRQVADHSQEALGRMKDFHKSYGQLIKAKVTDMGHCAKNLNPFGVFGCGMTITFVSVGHAIGTVFTMPSHILANPKTPKQRATLRTDDASENWLEARGLTIQLVGLDKMAELAGMPSQEMLRRAQDLCSGDERPTAASRSDPLGNVTLCTESVGGKGAGIILGEKTLWLVISQRSLSV